MNEDKHQWLIIHDNETDLDLLNYHPIVETIKTVILGSGDDPITIGVHGDWGAGKSSVLKMLEKSFEEEEEILCAPFNGWLFQEFEDAKIALLESLLNTIEKKRPREGTTEKARKLLKRVDWLKVGKLALKYGTPAASALLTGVPISPGFFSLSPTQKPGGTGEKGEQSRTFAPEKELECLSSIIKPPDDKYQVTAQIERFRKDFGELLDDSKISRLVVLVDDLDRCLPTTTIETLEAIRLFLFIPKTAFVIAADENMIRYAVSRHYPQLPDQLGSAAQTSSYSQNYLEKLVQVPFRLPSLGRLATEVYVLLLLVQYESGIESDDFTELKDAFRKSLSVPWGADPIDFDFISKSVELEEGQKNIIKDHLFIANQISPLLSEATQGNPRQIKRFINTLRLYLQIARSMGQESGVLLKPVAKLILLERFRSKIWDEIGRDSMGHPSGRSEILQQLELKYGLNEDSRKEDKTESEEKSAGKEELQIKLPKSWDDDMWLQKWAALKPSVSEEDLRPYFLVAQDIRLPGFYKTLSPEITRLAQVLMAGEMQAAGVLPQIRQLTPEQADDLFKALKGELVSTHDLRDEPNSAMALQFLVKEVPNLIDELVNALREIPLTRVGTWPAGTIFKASPSPTPPSIMVLLSDWEQQDKNVNLKHMASTYKKQLSKKRG